MNERRCMLVAGEASGDTLAAELVTALKPLGQWVFFGAGGPRMEAAGVQLVYDLTAHAVVGVWEVVNHYPELRRIFNQLLAAAEARQAEVVILVDYPGFNLRLARALKARVRQRRSPFYNWNPKLVYYVSPQLWAWHESRVHQIARDVDLLLSIFPFEKDWYAARAPKLRVEYVGHPLLDRHPRNAECGMRSAESSGASPSAFCLPPSAFPSPLVLLLPGSRARELRQHLPVMVEAARQIASKRTVRWRMIVPDQALAEMARPMIQALDGLEIETSGLAEALAQADLALASSGTVTMECAYFGVPTVVIYRVAWPTYQLGKRFIKVKYIAMPNLLANESLYPELIQYEATPERIAAEALDLLTNTARRAALRRKLEQVIASLGPPGAAQRAAQAIMNIV